MQLSIQVTYYVLLTRAPAAPEGFATPKDVGLMPFGFLEEAFNKLPWENQHQAHLWATLGVHPSSTHIHGMDSSPGLSGSSFSLPPGSRPSSIFSHLSSRGCPLSIPPAFCHSLKQSAPIFFHFPLLIGHLLHARHWARSCLAGLSKIWLGPRRMALPSSFLVMPTRLSSQPEKLRSDRDPVTISFNPETWNHLLF